MDFRNGGQFCELSVFEDKEEIGYINLYDHSSSLDELMGVLDEVGVPRKTPESLQAMYDEQAREEYIWHLKRQQARENAMRRNAIQREEEAAAAAAAAEAALLHGETQENVESES